MTVTQDGTIFVSPAPGSGGVLVGWDGNTTKQGHLDNISATGIHGPMSSSIRNWNFNNAMLYNTRGRLFGTNWSSFTTPNGALTKVPLSETTAWPQGSYYNGNGGIDSGDVDSIPFGFLTSGMIMLSERGVYLATACVRFVGNGYTGGFRQVSFNTGGVHIGINRQSMGGYNGNAVINVTTVFNVTTGGYIELYVCQDSGGTMTIDSQTYTNMVVAKLA